MSGAKKGYPKENTEGEVTSFNVETLCLLQTLLKDLIKVKVNTSLKLAPSCSPPS